MFACFWPLFSVAWPPFLPSCWHGSCGTRVPACWRRVSLPLYQATFHALWPARLTTRASPFLPCSLPTTYGWVRFKFHSLCIVIHLCLSELLSLIIQLYNLCAIFQGLFIAVYHYLLLIMTSVFAHLGWLHERSSCTSKDPVKWLNWSQIFD